MCKFLSIETYTFLLYQNIKLYSLYIHLFMKRLKKQDYFVALSSWYFKAASTKPRNNGCGLFGLDLNSG